MYNTLSRSQLTVIIPFLNEGEEVAHTVESVCRYAGDKVDILVINDASQALYDYEEMLRPYAVTYIRNEKRMGVAACRDMGVQRIETPYFLFLDAHMRGFTRQAGTDAWLATWLRMTGGCCAVRPMHWPRTRAGISNLFPTGKFLTVHS